MKILICLLLYLFFYSICYSQSQREFNLKKDIGNFSELMTEKDTICVLSDFRICTGIRFEKDLITKKENQVYIQIWVEDSVKGKATYEKKAYNFNASDSLNFEYVYKKLQTRNVKNKRPKPTFKLIHNNKDTLILHTFGLVDKIQIGSYLFKIKNQLYPDKDYYKPIEIP